MKKFLISAAMLFASHSYAIDMAMECNSNGVNYEVYQDGQTSMWIEINAQSNGSQYKELRPLEKGQEYFEASGIKPSDYFSRWILDRKGVDPKIVAIMKTVKLGRESEFITFHDAEGYQLAGAIWAPAINVIPFLCSDK